MSMLGIIFILVASITTTAQAIGDPFYSGPGVVSYEVTSVLPSFKENQHDYTISGKCLIAGADPKTKDAPPVTYHFTIVTKWSEIGKTVVENISVVAEPWFFPIGPGELTAKCPADPVIYGGDCSDVHFSGVYGKYGVPTQLLSRNLLSEAQKATLRGKVETPKIEHPLANHIYGDQFRLNEFTFRVPLFITQKTPLNVQVNLQQQAGAEKPFQSNFVIPFTELSSAPYGGTTIYAVSRNLDLGPGTYKIEA